EHGQDAAHARRPAAHQAPPARGGGGPQAADQDAAPAGHPHPAAALRGHDRAGPAQAQRARLDDQGLIDMGGTGTMHRATAGGQLLADRLRPAHTHWRRLRGLLGTKRLDPGEGLWIKPSNQVHMFGMRYALDLVFLDADGRVLRLVYALAPNRISPRVAGATSV